MITKSFLFNPTLANRILERVVEEQLPMHLQRGLTFNTEGGKLCKVSIDLEEIDIPLLEDLIEEEEKAYDTLCNQTSRSN